MSVQAPPARQAAAEDSSKSERTRRRILDAAANAFKEKGYAATRLEEIAEAAQIKGGSVYYHFGSKEEILLRVLEIGMAGIFDAVRAAAAGQGPGATHRARLQAAIAAHLAMLLRHGDYTAANIRIFGQVPPSVRRRHWPEREAYGEWWRAALQDARDAGEIAGDVDLSLLRMMLLGALNWSVEWYDRRGRTVDSIAAELASWLFEGIAPRPA